MSNYVQQFGAMLNGLEDGELKTSLINAYGNVKLDFEQAIDKRAEIKNEFNAYKQGVNNVFGTDKVDEIRTKYEDVSKSSKNQDIDKLKADLQSKYEADTNELRQMLEAEKGKYSELSSKHSSMLFNNEVERQGLLQGFKTNNPRIKEMLLSEIKDKLILEDNVFYVKDNTTGDKARDIKTGNYLSAKSVAEAMLQNEMWIDFVSPDVKANGSGTPPSNQIVPSSKKFNEMTSGELVALRRDNPAKYQQLKEAANL